MISRVTPHRVGLLTAVASTQLAVQLIGFLAGLLLVRYMPRADYGHYTLAMSLLGTAIVLTDLGLSAAVMACGGRLLARGAPLYDLMADAADLHGRIAIVSLLLCLPGFAWMLSGLSMPLAQVAALTLLIGVATLCHVRSAIALSVLRVQGQVAFPQMVELGVNFARLVAFSAALWLAFDATIALLLVCGAAAAQFALLARRANVGRNSAMRATGGAHRVALVDHLRRQAPNAIYFVLSSQIGVWLVSVMGNADRVAEVGALGRLAVVFSIIGAVSAALVQPYFARQKHHAELSATFLAANAFFAVLLAVLVGLSVSVPEALLWVLGSQYSGLHTELLWLVVSATFAAWGGALYSLGASRGWVQPVGVTIAGGVLAIVLVVSLVDVSTVRGAFMLNSATAFVGAALCFAYLFIQLQSQARMEGKPA